MSGSLGLTGGGESGEREQTAAGLSPSHLCVCVCTNELEQWMSRSMNWCVIIITAGWFEESPAHYQVHSRRPSRSERELGFSSVL